MGKIFSHFLAILGASSGKKYYKLLLLTVLAKKKRIHDNGMDGHWNSQVHHEIAHGKERSMIIMTIA